MSLTIERDNLVGELREGRNTASESRGSIHDDATASKLGFRGGTVAGSLHMDQFVPLALELYGDDYWKVGNLSFYFRQATVDREKVRAFARRGAPHARVWMENEAGALVAEGTASARGADSGTSVQNLLESQTKSDPGGLRILKDVKVSDKIDGLEATVGKAALDHRLETIPERLPIYDEPNAPLPPSMIVHLFRGHAQEKLYRSNGPAVGLFGAIETQEIAGPLRAETPYRLRAEVLALSESPKTENVWYRAWASDQKTGADIASMLMYLRYMKASSPHYA